MLGFQLSAYAVDQSAPDTVEMYSDEMPKSKLVFTLDLSKDNEWRDGWCEKESINIRMKQVWENLCTQFTKCNFYVFSEYPSSSPRKGDHIIGKLYENKLESCLFLRSYYVSDDNPSADTLAFTQIEGKVRQEYFSPSRWKIYSPCLGRYSGFNFSEMSWKDVAASIIEINSNRIYPENMDEETMIYEKLYLNIQTHGLENSIVRLAVQVNKSFQFSFYTVYDTEEQNQNESALLKQFESLLK